MPQIGNQSALANHPRQKNKQLGHPTAWHAFNWIASGVRIT